MVSRCFCAKLRTCACAKRMSSRSRFAHLRYGALDLLRREAEARRLPVVELFRQVADRGVTARLHVGEDAFDRGAHFRVGGFDGIGGQAAFEEACH